MTRVDSDLHNFSSYYQFDSLSDSDPLLDRKTHSSENHQIRYYNSTVIILTITSFVFILLIIFGLTSLPIVADNFDCGQLPPTPWRLFPDSDLYFPIYSTHQISQPNNNLRKAILVQHGNLRNGRDYFCAAVQALQATGQNPDEYLIIGPQFLIDKDSCWNSSSGDYQVIDASRGFSCSYYIWTSEGWKDGKSPVNLNLHSRADNQSIDRTEKEVFHERKKSHSDRLPFRLQAPITSDRFFSYDIFNLLINQLGREELFPNLSEIVLFGFSAGGQTLLRYSMYPNYNETILQERESRTSTTRVSVKTIVGDVSSYLFFDERRPFTNHTYGFGVPQPDWIRDWQTDAAGNPWIHDWIEDKCSLYNDWRFGLDHLDGYYLYHSQWNPLFRQSLISEFPYRNIQFLVGLNDSLNCHLSNPFPSTASIQANQSITACDDNELATYCQAMLQGENRLDRFLKWRDYVNQFYRSLIFSNQTFKINNEEFLFNRDHLKLIQRNHLILYVEGVTHDPVAMIKSTDGKCLLFDDCLADSL